MKRGILTILIFLLTISSVLAFKAEYEPIQNEALPGGSVSYLLHITNNELTDNLVTIKSVDTNWLLDQEGQTLRMNSGEAKDFTVSFKPLGRIKPGRYGINLVVSIPTTKLEKVITATVVDYAKVLDVEFSNKPLLDTRRSNLIKLKVRNNNNVLLNDLNLEIKSEHFEVSKRFSLDKKQEVELELPVKISEDAIKGEYNSNVKVSLNNNLMVDKELSYEVGEYEDVKQVVEPEGRLLISGESITLKNEGNSDKEESYVKEFDYLAYKFASFDPEPTKVKKEDGSYKVEWSYLLVPGESKNIVYLVNYRFPTFVLILIIIIVAVVYLFRKQNAIVVSKKLLAMQGHTGNVHIMKVVISIKNRGNMAVNNVRVIDRVPHTIKTPAQFGTVKPNQIKSMPDGTVMVWDIAKVNRGEEKIISYRIEGKLQHDKLLLPSAVAKYTSFGRGMAARSGVVSLGRRF